VHMRILYLTQYYPPEIGAGASRAYEMSMSLAGFGHSVTVLTEFPSYSSGAIPPKYRGKLFVVERVKGVTVVRVWTYPTDRASMLERLLNYVSFMLMSIVYGLRLGEFDLIYATTPTPFTGLSAFLISFVKRVKFVYEVRDLWPEYAVELGVLKNPLAVKVGMGIGQFCYSRARLLIPVTQGICSDLVQRGFGQKAVVVRNGVNTELFRRGSDLRERLGLEGKFVAVFAGVLGITGAVESLLESARILSGRGHDDICFLFVGGGIRKQRLVQKSKEYGLNNVVFLEPQPEDRLPFYLNSADVGIATLRDARFARGAIPTKMLTYMACELPVILGIQGEAEEIIRDAQAGIAVEPENPEQLSTAILKLYSDKQLATEMGKRGRAFVVERFSRKDQARVLERNLLEMLGQDRKMSQGRCEPPG
jgi:glycosyltransferase involved in cell wall biosynthesis